MRKIVYCIFASLLLLSCGKEKEAKVPAAVEEVKDKYVVSLDAIYEKNDTCMVFIYDENNNEFLDKRIKIAVKGSPNFQKIDFQLPEGLKPSNLGIGFSSNKEQESLTLKSITIQNKENAIVKADDYLTFFANNDCLVMDLTTSKHKLKHDKEYPPGFVGNDKLKAALSGN